MGLLLYLLGVGVALVILFAMGIIVYFGAEPFWDWDLDYQMRLIPMPQQNFIHAAIDALEKRIANPDTQLEPISVNYADNALDQLLI